MHHCSYVCPLRHRGGAKDISVNVRQECNFGFGRLHLILANSDEKQPKYDLLKFSGRMERLRKSFRRKGREKGGRGLEEENKG